MWHLHSIRCAGKGTRARIKSWGSSVWSTDPSTRSSRWRGECCLFSGSCLLLAAFWSQHSDFVAMSVFTLILDIICHKFDGLFTKGEIALEHSLLCQVSRLKVAQNHFELRNWQSQVFSYLCSFANRFIFIYIGLFSFDLCFIEIVWNLYHGDHRCVERGLSIFVLQDYRIDGNVKTVFPLWLSTIINVYPYLSEVKRLLVFAVCDVFIFSENYFLFFESLLKTGGLHFYAAQ